MGVYVGYLVATAKNTDVSTLKLVGGLAVVGISANLAVLLPQAARLQQLSLLSNIVIGALIRPLYCLAFSMACYLAFLRPDVLISKFMSSKLMIVAGRLSYTMFMAQYVFIWIETITTRTPISFESLVVVSCDHCFASC